MRQITQYLSLLGTSFANKISSLLLGKETKVFLTKKKFTGMLLYTAVLLTHYTVWGKQDSIPVACLSEGSLLSSSPPHPIQYMIMSFLVTVRLPWPTSLSFRYFFYMP